VIPESAVGSVAAIGADVLVDSHCHLDQLSQPAAVVETAAAVGVTTLVAVSENPDSINAVLQLRASYPGTVIAGLGLHPAWVVQQPREQVEAAIDQLKSAMGMADLLGEVGLDHKWAESVEQKLYQEEVLDRQLSIAARLEKPINLHSRRCQRQVMEKAVQYRRQSGQNAQLHWFTQSKKLIRVCNYEGIYVSVGPTVVDDQQAQAVACEISDELLLLESDAPVPVGERPGHPSRVREVAEVMARLKGCPLAEIARRTTDNFARYLST
jgi:TatD DNase family protein